MTYDALIQYQDDHVISVATMVYEHISALMFIKRFNSFFTRTATIIPYVKDKHISSNEMN